MRTVLLAGLVLAPALARGARWENIPADELAVRRPRVDPGAGVEILHREVVIDDTRVDGTSFRHHLRLKVFNRRGVEALSRIDIVDTRTFPVRNIAARVVHPDGRSVELDASSIHSREVLRRGVLRVRVKSFSFPGLAPGCVVEYRWEETNPDRVAGLQLHFQSEFPTWHVRFRIKPFDYGSYGLELRTLGYLFPMADVKPDANGYYAFRMSHVAATRQEALMPPDDETQPWIMFYFIPCRQTPDAFWRDYGRKVAETVRRPLRPTREIALQARELTAGVGDDLGRLQRLHDFCRTKIRNIELPHESLTPEQIEALDENRTAADVLARGLGTADDVNALFVSLAASLGYEARFARVGDRSERFFNASITSSFMLPQAVAAVKLDGSWRFFDAGAAYVPFGRLAWRNEGVPALICDRRDPEFVTTPVAEASVSTATRTADVAIDEAGTLSGTARLVFRGHQAVSRKTELAAETPARREAIVRRWLWERMPRAEVSGIVITGAEDPFAPLTVAYRVRVPGYAERVGRRLFIGPSFFERGSAPVLAAETREFDLYFPFPQVEDDLVELTLPPGYDCENPTAPVSVQGGNAVDYQVRLTRLATGNRFEFARTLTVGGMFYPRKFHPALKQAFDEIHRQDNHLLVARRRDGAPFSDFFSSP